MKYALPLLFLLVVNYSAFARLGETQAQIETRYGAPRNLPFVESHPPVDGLIRKAYLKNDVQIDVTYLNDKSVCECYERQNSAFTDELIQTLLGINSLGSKWVLKTRPVGQVDNGEKTWELANGAATADMEGNRVEIMTKECAKMYTDEEARQKAIEDNPLLGF
jgi:hypothetical protein